MNSSNAAVEPSSLKDTTQPNVTQGNATQQNTMSAATEVAGKPFAHNNS
jgi:hypothetical protein